MRKLNGMVGAAGMALAAFGVTVSQAAPARPAVVFDKLAPGFVGEVRNAYGFPAGTGFAAANPWGQYTAYLMLTDARGRRTWRIEHNLPTLGHGWSQGSTMYLLEGSQRALLIDTANPAEETEGVNDLKTLVRHLLGHDNAGKPKAKPVDFVVANTHSHGDHTGENARMSDRTVYYMDGDWPQQNVPPNYVPIREGGGATKNGNGMAVGQIDLGGRLIRALNAPPHTDGSIAYLDADAQLLVTGDALGSAWPFLQRGPITQYAQTMRHLLEVTAPYPDIVLLPAHYYQEGALDRAAWPADQQVLDRRYMVNQSALAEALVNGEAIGTPFMNSNRDYWAVRGTAKIAYNLDTIGRAGEALPSPYRIAEIPGPPPHDSFGRQGAQPLNTIVEFATRTFLIRGPNRESLFLLRGSTRALLIGTGTGAPGLAAVVSRLAGGLPLDVALLDGDANQVGGLAQLAPQNIYIAAGTTLNNPLARPLANGARIDLGTNPDGSALRIEAQTLAAPGKPSLTLINLADHALFVGNVLGEFAPNVPLEVAEPLPFAEALADWMMRADGRYRSAYATRSPAWFNDPEYVRQVQQALLRGVTGRGAGRVADGPQPTSVRITAETPPNAAASVIVPRALIKP